MEENFGEWLFYMGVCISGCSLLLGVFFFFLFRSKKKTIQKKLEREYGLKC